MESEKKRKGKAHRLCLLSFHCCEPSEHIYSVLKENKLPEPCCAGFVQVKE